MPRRRIIDPEFWVDEKVGMLSRDARLTFIGLWNLADDSGNLIYSPTRIRAQLYPYDPDATENIVECWLNELLQLEMLWPYEVDGNLYVNIRSFLRWQVINRPSKTRLPSINDNGASRSTHGALTEHLPHDDDDQQPQDDANLTHYEPPSSVDDGEAHGVLHDDSLSTHARGGGEGGGGGEREREVKEKEKRSPAPPLSPGSVAILALGPVPEEHALVVMKYSTQQIDNAYEVAVKRGAPRWDYLIGILKREEGRSMPTVKSMATPATPDDFAHRYGHITNQSRRRKGA